MPDQSANLASFRLGQHMLRCWMSVYVPAVVVNGTVTYASPTTATDIQISFQTGAYTDLEYGMEVEFFDSTGLLRKGRTNLRHSGVITSGSIPVREYDPAALQLVPGDKVKIYNEFRLHDKMVAAEPGFSPERLFYTDEGANPKPLPNSGGAWAGKTSMLPVIMTGSTSALVDPDSSTPVTHLWDIDGLSYASGNSTSANPTLTGAAGTYLLRHTVTDPDNGKSITQHIPVMIDAAPYKVIVEDLPNDEARGGSARVRMLQNATLANVPDGALCILWKEEWIAGTRQSFGARAPGRSHILFVGILRREEGEFDSDDGVEGLSFDLISPLARLEELMGYGKIMLREASPDAWSGMKALTVKRGIIQLPMFYTTLMESGYDLAFTSTYSDRDYSGFALQQSTPLGQMRELAKHRHARLIEDRRGRFEVQMRPERMALSDRASLPVTLTLTKRDVLRWRYTREHWNPLNRVEVRGFIAGATVAENLPIFSLYPGDAPLEGNQQTVEEALIVTDQDELNEGAGMIGGALAGEYVDANGVRQRALDLELTLRGVYDVFDFYDEVIELDWTTLRRGLDLSAAQYVLVSSSVAFADGTATTTLRLRTCTAAPAGKTYIPATESTPPYTPPGDIPVPWVPPLPPLPPYNGVLPTRGLVFSASEGKVCQIVGLTGAGLTFGPDIAGVSNGEFYAAYSNPYLYKQAYGLGDVGLETSPDVSTNTAFSLLQTNASLFGSGQIGHRIRGSIHRSGFGAAVSGANYFRSTLDGWATLQSASSINGAALDPDDGSTIDTRCDFCLCGHNAGHIYALAPSGAAPAIYRSTDYGATWTHILTTVWGYACGRSWIDVPYMRIDGTPNRDDANVEVYQYNAGVSGGGCGDVTVSLYVGGVFVTNSAEPESLNANALNNNPMTTFTYSGDQFYFVNGIGDVKHMDSFGSPTGSLVNDGDPVSVNGWSPNPLPAIAWSSHFVSGQVHVTVDSTTWVNGLPAGWAAGIAYSELSLWTVQ